MAYEVRAFGIIEPRKYYLVDEETGAFYLGRFNRKIKFFNTRIAATQCANALNSKLEGDTEK